MKSIVRRLKLFPLILPIVFSILFFGLMAVKVNVVIQTDNISGEGICMTYLCKPVSFSPFYETGFYFGSELKKATILGYNYDIDAVSLTISDVSEFDIVGLDSSIWNIPLRHYDGDEILTTTDRFEDENVLMTSGNGVFHVEVKDTNEGITINLKKNYVPALFWVIYFFIILLASVLLTLFMDFLSKHWPILPYILIGISGITVTLLSGQFFCGSLPFAEFKYFFLNWLFLYAFSVFLGALTLPWIGTVATMGFTSFWYIANYFVIALRSKPIMPSDLKAIGTAAEVMGGYVFRPNWEMIIGIAVVIMYAAGITIVSVKHRKADLVSKSENARATKKTIGLILRGVAIATSVIVFIIGLNTSTFKNLNSFSWDAALQKSFHKEGMVLTYLKTALKSGVTRPEGYSRELVDGYLDDYPAEAAEGVRPTNIIMVMNEAFADLRTVGLDENIDVMPFIDSLDENVVEGSLYVSIFGGGTCNTEFEGLTGNTLAFLGTGAYPYTENVTAPLFSLAQYFSDAGYITEAFHANEAHNWNRNMVYPNLGFETFHSIMDYAQALGDIPYLHGHPADTADYAYIEKTEAEHAGQPTFLFNVTMQNHSGYERWEDVEKAASVEEFGSEYYPDTQVYLSLVKASDDAVKQLVETYRDSDEPTMIIFFGDHQPGLPAIAQREFYRNVDSYLDWYKSKFFIWTNYGTETAHDVEISANYLPWLILERGHFPLPPYVQMLREVHERYPVISAMGVIDAEGNEYGSVNELPDDPLIQKYRNIQYANMFDAIDEAWFQVK